MEETAIAQEVVEEAIADAPVRIPTMEEVIAAMGEKPLLPKPYISMTTAPNRRTRRLAHQRQVRLMRRFETWKRTLLSYEINPEDVLMERQEKRKIKRLPKVRTRTTRHNQRRRAAQGRKHNGTGPTPRSH